MKGAPKNLPDLEDPCLICILTRATKIPKVPTINVLKSPPRFMIQMDFAFFNVESIHGFTSTFVTICSATLCLFGFTSIIKRLPLDILKLPATIFKNKDKTV